MWLLKLVLSSEGAYLFCVYVDILAIFLGGGLTELIPLSLCVCVVFLLVYRLLLPMIELDINKFQPCLNAIVEN
jgi:MFS superfamily sulfate permease-like transporter